MRLGGRLSAAIEVIAEIEERKRPVSVALKDWGNTHRFAGSSDRAAIGNLVYDVFRKRRSFAWSMNSDDPAALVFATLTDSWGFDEARLSAELTDDRHAPENSNNWIAALSQKQALSSAPDSIQADLPDWLSHHFQENFDDEWIAEGKAFGTRPPLDLRVNMLKADRAKVKRALARTGCRETTIARHGLRIAPPAGAGRLANVQAEEGYRKGWFEVQDEGSQIAAELVFAQPGEQVLDYCAGAGGKTLSLAASMENRGQINAYDADRHRLAPIYERLQRAGVRNVQVHGPDDAGEVRLAALEGRMDRVLVDAPCTGSGTWRRHPEAKWKLTPDALQKRVEEQKAVLEDAAVYVRSGGFLVYVTCSVLAAENEDQMLTFLEGNPGFELVSVGEVWQEIYGFDKPQPWSADLKSITLTPASTGTDGFFIAVAQRVA